MRIVLIRCLSLCILLVFLVGSFGCGGKSGGPGRGGDGGKKTTKKGRRIKATQRPYVINGITYYPIPSARGYAERGLASWYGNPFHGRKTSNGETYDMYGDTAAHKTLPMNTMLLVKNLDNGRTTVVRINDRGPFVEERIIDLSYTKAKELGVVRKGTARVEIIALAEGEEEVSRSAIATRTQDNGQGGGQPFEGDVPQTTALIKKEPRKVSPVPDFDQGNFYVQVGAFAEIENARALARAFTKRGKDVVLQQYPAAGMNLYRVLIFAGHSLAKAKKYEKKMEAEGYRHALVLAR